MTTMTNVGILAAMLSEHAKTLHDRIQTLQYEQVGCINERAHLRPWYAGRIEEIERELLYLTRLLNGE